MIIVVLTPSNRRQSVKVMPHWTLFQVLNEVCDKQHLNVESYDLLFHNSALDLSSQIKFAGVPNNALLEMVPATRQRAETSVNVAVQLESNQRLVDRFPPSTTLWHILNTLCPGHLDPASNPAVIYLLKEITGIDNLQRTTLKSLGLACGNAILRLIHRNPESVGHQANISKPLIAKVVQTNTSIDENKRENCSKIETGDAENKFTVQSTSATVSEDDKTAVASEEQESSSETVDTTRAESCDEVEHNDFIFIDERDTIVFNSESFKFNQKEESDDFFDLTTDDVLKLYKDLQKKREELENKPLVTAGFKKVQESNQILANLGKYKRTLIRVQFPDHHMIQSFFYLTETVGKVKELVRSVLDDNRVQFELFTVPPKTVLDEQQTLVEAHCVPNALLFFACTDANDSDAGTVRKTSFLKPSLYGKLSTFSSLRPFFERTRKSPKTTDTQASSSNSRAE